MTISTNQILNKIERELVCAKQTTGEAQRVHIHVMHVLCELLLDQTESHTNAMREITQPKIVQVEKTLHKEIEIKGDSLLDF